MPGKTFPNDALAQAQTVLDAWKEIDEKVTFGGVTVDSLTANLTQADAIRSQMNSLEAQLTNLRDQRDALDSVIWDEVKRVRSGVKSQYGDDSPQYEMVGGTRLSERKPAARKKATTT